MSEMDPESDAALFEAARRLHNALACSYGEFDPNYADWWSWDLYDTAKAYVAAWEAQNPHGAPKEQP